MKVLVSDPLSEVGIKIFQETPELEVDVNIGLTSEELKEIISAYDALVIRSATRVTADVIEAAQNLKVIGRAGIGLDNVDIPAASKRGIVVMNTPHGNTITTAEHTIAMIMAVSRSIPQATASLREGKWEKKRFQGREIFNKTLGLIGVGNVGRIVAEMARQGFDLKIHYPIPIHRQVPYAGVRDWDLPQTDRAVSRIMSLPVTPELSDENRERIIRALLEICRELS